MRGFERHGRHHKKGFGRHGGFPRGLMWMFGIGIFMMWGPWWPVVLIVLGIGLVGSVIWSASANQEMDEMERQPLPPIAPPQPPLRPYAPPVDFNRPAPAPVGPRIELLPATCPRCGGPVRSPEVKWRGERFAACAYCGSNLVNKTGKA